MPSDNLKTLVSTHIDMDVYASTSNLIKNSSPRDSENFKAPIPEISTVTEKKTFETIVYEDTLNQNSTPLEENKENDENWN